MISAEMKEYNYFAFGAFDAYGQPQLSAEPVGTIKMAIFTTSQSAQDNVNYRGANYIGLTFGTITDKNVIENGTERYKVLYIQPKGRYKQVFMVKM